MMNDNNDKKRPLTYYYMLMLVLILVFNSVIMPMFFNPKMKEVSYNNFLQMVDEGKVSKVEITDKRLAAVDKNNEKEIYVTGRVEDPELANRLMKSKVEFTQVVPKEQSPLVTFFTNWVLPILIFFGLGQLFMYFMGKRMGGNAMSFGKSNAKVYVEAQTGKSFADVAGQDEAKEALMELVDFLHNPGKYKDIGANMPKGALLVGPPGTGKTLLARAVAGEAKVPFFSISGSEFVEMFVGMGAARVRDLFKQAQEKAPCIVFIDEIDAIGKRRDNGQFGGNDEREQTLNQLLSEMDGFDGSKGVVILAATNRPESLDKALLRPGRFDRQVYVGAPDMKGREDILKVHARGKQFDPDVRFDSIAKSTAGFTGADLENLLNEAALLAARRNKRLISMEDIEDSFLKVIMGTEKKSRVMTDREKRLTAYHEAGHAIATRCLPTQDPVHTISIIPRGRAGGFTMSLPQEEKFYASKNEMLDDLIVLLGGRVAEKLTMDDISTGASNDIERATSVAKSMVTKYGMSDLIGPINYSSGQQEIFLGRDMVETDAISEDVAAKIDEEIRRIILEAYAKCEDILKEHMDQLSAVGEYLIRNETMDGDAFEKMFNGEEVPDHETGAQVFHIESGMAKTAKQDEENGTDAPQAADATVSLEEAAKKLFVDDKKDEEQSSEPEDEGE